MTDTNEPQRALVSLDGSINISLSLHILHQRINDVSCRSIQPIIQYIFVITKERETGAISNAYCRSIRIFLEYFGCIFGSVRENCALCKCYLFIVCEFTLLFFEHRGERKGVRGKGGVR